MRLGRVLVSSDLNPDYLGCWPLARRAWPAVAGLEPLLVLVARAEEVPGELRSDPLVHVVEPVDGLHTAFQAQCIRLLYPALLEGDEAVVTADVDMLPLNRAYFHTPVSRIDARHFVAYRDVLLWVEEIPICYNAAAPATWREIFGVGDLDDVRARLAAWGAGLEYDGRRGGRGWDTDQVLLYRTLLGRGAEARDIWILDDAYTGHRRLDRALLEEHGGLNDAERRRIERGSYSDYHCVLPNAQFRALNERVVDVAVAVAR